MAAGLFRNAISSEMYAMFCLSMTGIQAPFGNNQALKEGLCQYLSRELPSIGWINFSNSIVHFRYIFPTIALLLNFYCVANVCLNAFQ